ncbi:hypothetical protein D3C75_596910 [compost metagenome]
MIAATSFPTKSDAAIISDNLTNTFEFRYPVNAAPLLGSVELAKSDILTFEGAFAAFVAAFAAATN